MQQQQLDVPLMSQPELLWLPPQQVHVPLMVQAGLMWMPSLQEQLAGELSLVATVMQWTPALDVLGALRLVQAWEGAQKGGGRWGRQKQQMEWVQGQLLGVCGLHWAAPGGQMLVEDLHACMVKIALSSCRMYCEAHKQELIEATCWYNHHSSFSKPWHD